MYFDHMEKYTFGKTSNALDFPNMSRYKAVKRGSPMWAGTYQFPYYTLSFCLRFNEKFAVKKTPAVSLSSLTYSIST